MESHESRFFLPQQLEVNSHEHISRNRAARWAKHHCCHVWLLGSSLATAPDHPTGTPWADPPGARARNSLRNRGEIDGNPMESWQKTTISHSLGGLEPHDPHDFVARTGKIAMVWSMAILQQVTKQGRTRFWGQFCDLTQEESHTDVPLPLPKVPRVPVISG